MAINRTARVLVASLLWSGIAAAALTSAGCAAASRALGVEKVTPDEFRVVSKAPLVVPPDYALRPPTPGKPRPQELAPESQARLAILGRAEAANRSAGENLLAEKAGAGKADPLIRYVVDDEFGDVAHKDRGFADRVMFWKKGAPATPVNKEAAEAATTAAPVDPAVEAARVKSLTGDQPVTIQKAKPGARVKLPGL
ncbi:MAG: DUF3035 domain-containing protein [Caulobacteraceae bacterium]